MAVATITSMVPTHGLETATTASALTGTFETGARAFADGAPIPTTILNPTTLLVDMPPHAAAMVTVTVVNPGFATSVALAGGFTYDPVPPAPAPPPQPAWWKRLASAVWAGVWAVLCSKWLWLPLAAGVILCLVIAGGRWGVVSVKDYFTRSSPTAAKYTLRDLVHNMQRVDTPKKPEKREFHAQADPLFFTLPPRLIMKISKDEWAALASEAAKAEGDNVAEEMLYIRFHAVDKQKLEYASIGVKGKFQGEPAKEYEVTVFRDVFPDDEDSIARLATIVLDEVPRSPQLAFGGYPSSGSSGIPKASIKLPLGGGAKLKAN
ncbi:hypothetical protein EXS70_01015 [Candidatus Peribacteria bacterium]|nr:hypothetical protein [Candidatus Peribacteria bacterium]